MEFGAVFFCSHEGAEPRHIHVESGDNYAKCWLEPIDRAKSVGYKKDRNQMRKRLKKKRRSCALCKPHKMGKAGRWKAADFDRLATDEKDIRKALRSAG